MEKNSAQMHLCEIVSATSRPTRPKGPVVIGSRDNAAFGITVAQGRIVYDYARMFLGDEAMSHIVSKERTLRLPRGFWPACTLQCLKLKCTDRLRKTLKKSLNWHIYSLRKGATTVQGMLGDKEATQKRSKTASRNALKCPELGQLLYDWFIDCLQIYNCRVHSLSLIHI